MKIIARFVFQALVCATLFGQSVRTHTIGGTVQDQTGAVIAGTNVELLGSDGSIVAHVLSDGQGAFHFDVANTGAYELDAQQTGFEEKKIPVKLTSSPLAPVKLVMRIAAQNEDIIVSSGDSPKQVSTEIADNQSANTVDRAALDRIPVFDQNYIATLSRFLSDDATGTNGVTLVVNGVEANGPGVSPSAIKSVKINQNPYSALYSRPGRARIEITTEEGTPEFHGTANFLYRDALFDARNAFSTQKPAEQRTYFEGSLTGPLGHNKKNTFLLSLEHDNDNQEAIVFAQDLNGPVNMTVPTPMRHDFAAARFFHDYGAGNQLWVSYSYEYESDKNQNVGGTVLPEAGTNVTSFEHEVNVGYTHVFSPRLLNQLHFLVGYNDNPVRSIHSAPGINVSGAFTGGGAQADTRRTEGHFDGTDVVSYSRGKQEIKFGIDVPDISRRGFDDYRNFGGTYSFASLDDYAAGNPYSYVVQQGNGHVTFLEKVLSGFFEDTIRARPNLSLSVGVRYYWQNYFHDIPYNFAPRFSVAYAPSTASKTVFRAGAGVFYDRTGPRPISDLLHFDGAHLEKLIATNPSYPVTEAEVSALPRGIVQLDPRLKIPCQIPYSVGVEQQVTAKSTLAVNYVGSRGVGLFRSIDANAPPPPLYFSRPNPNYGQIRQMQSTGSQTSNALEVTFRGRPVRYFSGQVQYTLGKTYNNTSGITYFPANSYFPRADWSRSDNDRRHKFDLLGTFTAQKLFDFGMALSLYSGKPVNITTGNDENNDGQALDRPTGTPRNALHGPGYVGLDLNLTHEFSLRKKKESPSLALTVNSFNLLNHTNDMAYIGVVSSPFFGHAVEANPPRRMQLNLEFKF